MNQIYEQHKRSEAEKKLNKIAMEKDKFTLNNNNLARALKEFTKKYPKSNRGDLQTFILGWEAAIKFKNLHIDRHFNRTELTDGQDWILRFLNKRRGQYVKACDIGYAFTWRNKPCDNKLRDSSCYSASATYHL